MAEVARLDLRRWYLANVAALGVVVGYQLVPKGQSDARFVPLALGVAYAVVLLHGVITLRDRLHDLPSSKPGLRRQLFAIAALALAMGASHFLVARNIDWPHALAWAVFSLLMTIGFPWVALRSIVRGQEALVAGRSG